MNKTRKITGTGKSVKSVPCLIIFTDLDGTLLDSAYSFKKALPALDMIKRKKVPLVLCSSKTRTEIEHCRKKLGNEHPFITENGGGVFIPKNNFKLQIKNLKLKIEKKENYIMIKLGAPYEKLREELEGLRSEGFDIRGFGDMSVKEISELTGLKTRDAVRAAQRDFDEPFVFKGDRAMKAKLKRRIKARGFNYTQGEFFHIMGDSDKGRAVGILKRLYAKQGRKLITAALGDSPNDIEMLQSVDHPIVVRKKDGSYNSQILRSVKGCTKADGIGPEGWNKAVIELLRDTR